jgi:hypothetical protein
MWGIVSPEMAIEIRPETGMYPKIRKNSGEMVWPTWKNRNPLERKTSGITR